MLKARAYARRASRYYNYGRKALSAAGVVRKYVRRWQRSRRPKTGTTLQSMSGSLGFLKRSSNLGVNRLYNVAVNGPFRLNLGLGG